MDCPICGRTNRDMLCPQCGFDYSRYYGKYPTFGPVEQIPAASALRKDWEEKQKSAKPELAKPPVQPPAPPAAHPAPKSKWTAFFLCLFFGMFGAHKFYEGKKRMGILYLCTGGLYAYGWLFDCIVLLFKPNPYYPRQRGSKG